MSPLKTTTWKRTSLKLLISTLVVVYTCPLNEETTSLLIMSMHILTVTYLKPFYRDRTHHSLIL